MSYFFIHKRMLISSIRDETFLIYLRYSINGSIINIYRLRKGRLQLEPLFFVLLFEIISNSKMHVSFISMFKLIDNVKCLFNCISAFSDLEKEIENCKVWNVEKNVKE